MAISSVGEAVHEVLRAQTRRAHLYAAFQTAFREMCATKNEGMYLKLLPQLTDEFRTVSEVVIACEEFLLSEGKSDLAKTIRLIQEQERVKLQATVSLQALQKAQAFDTLPWQNGSEAAWSEPDSISSSGQPAHSVHSCCHQHSGGRSVTDPSHITEQEWHGACSEATAALEHAVTCINDALEEIRYEEAEDGLM